MNTPRMVLLMCCSVVVVATDSIEEPLQRT
jgi:hypothetical protein